MFAKIKNYYHQVKRRQWIFNVISIALGTYLLIGSYTFFQGKTSHPSGILVIISGSLFLCCGLLSLISQSITTNVISALMAIVGAVLFFIS
ncbi:hypothetical protein JT359_19855 [Candidatus Poribacteria bacterium]|nr:hypothetical protein [Candidatus Poribacteria bacterium]